MIKDLIVLGGGNAGLMAALYLRASYPTLKIKVIKSAKIGTIGVGEGSTEHWRIFSDATGISNEDLVLEAGATIKSGVKFVNWHGDGTSYFHSVPEYLAKLDSYSGLPYNMMRLIGEGLEPGQLHWKVPSELGLQQSVEDFFQFHFDSEKLNALFLKKCSISNIEVVDAEIVDTVLDEQGFVKHIVDENRVEYPADFFVDSSGFRRIIASKLGAKWVDWSEYLPMNSAIAFPSPYQEEIPSYTLSKALSSGWHWRSPVQDRFGNGYVFSDAFISEDKAIEEIQKEFPDPIHIARKVNFIAGKVDRFWIKNCVSIGLSSSFVEPLEASSISTTIQQSRVLAGAISTWERNNTSSEKYYNKTFDEVMSNILDFIQLHYFTQREDTEFWRWCKHNLKMTDFNLENLEMFKTNFVNQLVLPTHNYCLYDIINWVQVMHGLRMFDAKSIKERYDQYYQHMTHHSLRDIDELPTPKTHEFFTCREAINIVKDRAKRYRYQL